MFNEPTSQASLLSKFSRLSADLSVTEFITSTVVILVTLFCAAEVGLRPYPPTNIRLSPKNTLTANINIRVGIHNIPFSS